MLAKLIDKIVALKETKTFEIAGQTYADAPLTRIPPHVDRPDCISVSGLDGICKLIRTELAKINTVIMVQAKSYKSVEVMTTYLPDFSRNILYRAEADVPGLRTGFRGREVALIELRSLFIPNEGTAYLLVSSRAPVWGASKSVLLMVRVGTGFKSCPRVGGICNFAQKACC